MQIFIQQICTEMFVLTNQNANAIKKRNVTKKGLTPTNEKKYYNESFSLSQCEQKYLILIIVK